MKTRRYKKSMRKKHTRKKINKRRNMTKKRKEVFVRNNNVTRRKTLRGGELNDKQKMYVSGVQQLGIHLLINGSSLGLTTKEKEEIKMIYNEREKNFMAQLGDDTMPVYEPQHAIESTDDDYVLFKYFRKNLKKETLADLIRYNRDTDNKLNPDTIAMVGMARLLISKKFFRSRLKPVFTLFKETYPDYLSIFLIKEPEQRGEQEEEQKQKQKLEDQAEEQSSFDLDSVKNAVMIDSFT